MALPQKHHSGQYKATEKKATEEDGEIWSAEMWTAEFKYSWRKMEAEAQGRT